MKTFTEGMFVEMFPERALSRNSDPSTSAEAAYSLSTQYLGELHSLIVHDLRHNGPSTTSELASRLGYPRDSISPRMKALVDGSLVETTGSKRPGPSKRLQIVWRAINCASSG